MPRYVIGVDNGGTAIKAALYDETGVLAGLARTPSVTRALPGGRVEIDLAELWRANAACVCRLVAESRVAPADIACIGFAGQGKGLYLLGTGGEPIRNAITSADDRARGYARRWAVDGTAARIFAKTLQGLFSVHPATLLRWLKDHEPETYARIEWVFSMKDYLVYRATGRVISDTGNQSGNGLVDLETRAYDPEILEILGVPEIAPKLPPMLHATDLAGQLTADAAAELGCAPGTPVIAGMFDVHASAVAAGLVDESTLCVITGTAGVNVYVAPAPVRDGSVAMNSLYCIPGYYLVEEGSNSSIGTLDWVIDVLFQDAREAHRDEPAAIYAEIERIASAVPSEVGGPIFLPYLAGDGGTGRSRGTWIGMSATDGRGELLRAAYEGMAFAHRRHVDRLLRNRPAPASLRLAGGGARSSLFVQLVADVLQLPVVVTVEDELGVKGVGMAAGIAAGFHRDFRDAVALGSPARATVTPDPTRAESYARKYARFLSAVDLLQGVWPEA